MKRLLASFALMTLILITALSAFADDAVIEDRVLGKPDAPLTVDEYVSLTCSHCAEFYNVTLPELEKSYVDTGKVKFILHDFPLDGVALKAAAIARCMPADEFYPYVKILYKNQSTWAVAKEPEKTLIQYARLGGLSEDKAKACLADTKLQDALIAERTDATQKLGIEATPTFIINGTETLKGAQPAATFTEAFDRMLKAKH
jgi:protein-disulfide isomerase